MKNEITGSNTINDFEEIKKGGELNEKPKQKVCKSCGRTTFSKDAKCLKCKGN